jgi:hypothetical protein
MSNLSRLRLVAFATLLLVFGLYSTSQAQDAPKILPEAQLSRIVPTSFYFEGQSGPTQMRNSAVVMLAPKRNVIAGLVDTSGYSSEVRGRYEGFIITDSSITVSGAELGTGAYGFGFSQDGKMNIFDVGGKQVLSVPAQSDQQLKRPRPLMMMKAADGVRLYSGRNYVTVAAK